MSHNEKLKIEKVGLSFGGLQALRDVSIQAREGEILAIIGPNGSGKSSLLNCINGFYRPQRGDIYFEGKRITRLSSHRIAKLGIARVFQNVELYTGLTTLDNLMAARHSLMKQGILAGAVYFGWSRREEVRHREVVERIIDFLEIEKIRKTEVGILPYGLRKRVELGRALALEPRLLLLDEAMSGMNLEEKEDMARFILDIFETQKIPIVLVEHDMGLVMDIADRVIVLEQGCQIAMGTPEEISRDPEVIKAYLGKEDSMPKRRRERHGGK
ncbi:MAG: ABC transporter ATP-binding protein [Proteobacteria bacterium]|nr:ABC transporter ATP-binding protein [Pseudomonadota bacterium]